MSDDLELELDNDFDAVEAARNANAEAKPTGQEDGSRQPRPNLDEFPEFREWKSRADSRDWQRQQEITQVSQRAAQMEQELHNIRMQGMDEVQQYAYQNQLLQQQIANLNRARELDAFAIQRQRDLEEIAHSTGIPIEQLYGARDTHEAWKIGYKHQSENGNRRQASGDERAPNDTVDVGGGRPSSAQARLQAEYDKAAKNYDMQRMMEVMSVAGNKGIAINEW